MTFTEFPTDINQGAAETDDEGRYSSNHIRLASPSAFEGSFSQRIKNSMMNINVPLPDQMDPPKIEVQ